MAAGGKFDYDKYMKGPEDYQNYFHADPISGYILLDGKNQPVLKNILWQNKIQTPSLL